MNGEETMACYKAVRDHIIFTNKRMIVVNVQGLVGKRKEFSIFPYSKLQAFSVETAGVIDIDTDVDLVYAGLGTVHLEFSLGIVLLIISFSFLPSQTPIFKILFYLF